MDNNTPAEHSSFPRRLVLAMAVIAAICFGTAWLKFNAGANHYEAYVEAYIACVNDPLFGSQAAEICKTTPQVRNHFTAQNAAYASVAPFLSLAVALTVAVILSPLTHRGSRWVEKRLARGHQMEAAADAS